MITLIRDLDTVLFVFLLFFCNNYSNSIVKGEHAEANRCFCKVNEFIETAVKYDISA